MKTEEMKEVEVTHEELADLLGLKGWKVVESIREYPKCVVFTLKKRLTG